MPTYEYNCPECKLISFAFHSITEEEPRYCRSCFTQGNKVQMVKGIGGGSAVHFKGKGFYATDYQ